MGQKPLRQLLKEAYPKSVTWAKKVDKMSDAQVVAVYLRMRGQGKVA